MKITIINGPNLNLLGSRETNIYGSQNFESYLDSLRASFPKITIEYFQSNIEGEIINKINSIDSTYSGLIINPAAYTHTSLAIYDSLKNLTIIKIEIHISNIYNREDFRKKSITAGACDSVISGFGVQGYFLALEYMCNKNG